MYVIAWLSGSSYVVCIFPSGQANKPGRLCGCLPFCSGYAMLLFFMDPPPWNGHFAILVRVRMRHISCFERKAS